LHKEGNKEKQENMGRRRTWSRIKRRRRRTQRTRTRRKGKGWSRRKGHMNRRWEKYASALLPITGKLISTLYTCQDQVAVTCT
jgi:hypothetical protein